MSFVWHLKIFLLKRTSIWHIVPNKTTNIDNMFFDKTKVFHTFCNKFWGVYFCPTIIILKVLNDHYFQKPNKSGEQFVRISVVCYFHWSRCWIAQCLALVVLLLSGLTVCQIGMPCSFILHDFKLMIYLGLTFKLTFWWNFQCE